MSHEEHKRTNYHEHAARAVYGTAPKSPSFPTIAEAERRLRKDRFHFMVRGCAAIGIASALLLLVSPWAWLGVGSAALGYFITCVWSGYHTFKGERPVYPPTAPFDERNRYIRDHFDV